MSPTAAPSGPRRRASRECVAVVASRAPLTSGPEHVQPKTSVWGFDLQRAARIKVFEQLKREIALGKVLLLRRTCIRRTLRCRREQCGEHTERQPRMIQSSVMTLVRLR